MFLAMGQGPPLARRYLPASSAPCSRARAAKRSRNWQADAARSSPCAESSRRVGGVVDRVELQEGEEPPPVAASPRLVRSPQPRVRLLGPLSSVEAGFFRSPGFYLR